jgi:hypothetical protein
MLLRASIKRLMWHHPPSTQKKPAGSTYTLTRRPTRHSTCNGAQLAAAGRACMQHRPRGPRRGQPPPPHQPDPQPKLPAAAGQAPVLYCVVPSQLENTS